MYGTEAYYDKTAAQWAENGYQEDGELACLGEFLAMLPEGGRVLDLCCGAGYESGRVKQRGFGVVGIDFSGESLRIARERNPQIPFYRENMLSSYAHIGQVDGILLIAGLVHIETRELPLAFRRMSEVLIPGGLALVSIREGVGKLPEWSYLQVDGADYDRNFIAHTLEELMAAAEGKFSYRRELTSDTPVWHYYVFQRNAG